MATLQNDLQVYDDTANHTAMSTLDSLPNELLFIISYDNTVPPHTIVLESLKFNRRKTTETK